eukprot:CAMPEP_0202419210 /NCGR_PEP_ID=MMETSP1128-20130828/48706_1 /ASSEMBLY_ACC=CAM_ASM_000463 /TAXON_ID=3047 /ORGANISM="Dunaliella tertiolecta, Strain CCMP1320" /LENGTH=75 /DNA_ID=CAMNT_0049027095 /DNA_START=406 /DNA_END=629 /DNA_ORIENTATION=-
MTNKVLPEGAEYDFAIEGIKVHISQGVDDSLLPKILAILAIDKGVAICITKQERMRVAPCGPDVTSGECSFQSFL